MNFLISVLEQSLVLLPLVYGVYLSYVILKITDLTVDGTYVLGASIFARTIDLGFVQAFALSICGGAIVGSFVSYMQKNNAISDLIAGILATFMLYSVNLQILGRPNISLLNKPTLLSVTGLNDWIIVLTIFGLLLIILLIITLKSNFGLLLRAFGHNQKLLKVLGKSVEKYRLFGLVSSNALAALSGALTAQMNGFSDINMGFGIALIAIGAVVIGHHIVINSKSNFSPRFEAISPLVGVLLYFISLNVILHLGIDPANLKFILGAILFLSLRNIRKSEIE